MNATVFFYDVAFSGSIRKVRILKSRYALEELLFNCSAKVLKSDKDLLVFDHIKVFNEVFLSVMDNNIN